MNIVRIIKVVDTREYTEVEGNNGRSVWKPIPGSGDEHQCARCGKWHEVHATVELADKTTCIVGTGCMKSEDVDMQSRVRKLTSASKRIAKLDKELAKWKALMDEKESIMAHVLDMDVPKMTEHEVEVVESDGYRYTKWEIRYADGTHPCSSFRPLNYQDREYAISSWRTQKGKDMGITFEHDRARSWFLRTRMDIDKLEDKFPELREEV